jgi:4-hydroxybenzoate polyprenyltransferase
MSIAARLRSYGNLVAFSHTVFAFPFAASALVLSRSYATIALTPLRVLAMAVCMVTARTSAMAFNRYADSDVDAKNPRTKTRHIPSGEVKPGEALALTIGAGGLFLIAAMTLGFWPAVLAPIVLVVLLGYSLAKRFTWGAHAWLGVALSLAPGGAWIATGAAPNAGILALMLGVLTWLLGFDVLYSLQDEAFDAFAGLHSIPARFGLTRAIVISAVSHVITVASFVVCGVLGCGALLVYEHALVGKGNLDKINKAFFDVNAYVSVVFFVFTLADELVRR